MWIHLDRVFSHTNLSSIIAVTHVALPLGLRLFSFPAAEQSYDGKFIAVASFLTSQQAEDEDEAS
jgi:hypothetical protein